LRRRDKSGVPTHAADAERIAADGANGSIHQLIVVGSSAGGIDALGVLVGSLPEPLPVPMILAQHLDPRRPSHLAEILSRRTSIPVRPVEAAARLEPGTILVLPPDRHAQIRDHEVVLSEAAEDGPRPSIDRVLGSAAGAFGEGLIAVILTGTGSDGALGARAVKAAGGTVIIQDPETASYPGMPKAIAPSTVDIVADLEAIGPLLHDLVSGTSAPCRPDEERLLRTFLEQLRDRTGIDFSTYKRAAILRRLQRRMAATGAGRLRDYVGYLADHPEEYQRLTSSFLIKVTEFFRDGDLFTYLRDEVLPQVIEEARGRGMEIRIWSAGTATGEEAYSVAMLVVDALGDELPTFNVRIFATDVDPDAIAFARRGTYPAAALEGVPASLVERHFDRVRDQYEIKKQVRAITVFGQHDLGQRAPFPRIDLVLCRNVLIYLTTELQRRALQLFAFSLRDHGYLVLGKAESTTPLAQHFVLEHPRLKVYRRQGDRVLIPPQRIKDDLPVAPIGPPAVPGPGWAGPPTVRGTREARPSSPGAKADALLLRLPVGVIVIDRHYDIQTINAAARELLAIHGTAVHEDLLHQLPDATVRDVRAATDRAFRGEPSSVVLESPRAAVEASGRRAIELSCHPLRSEGDGTASEMVLLLATDVTPALAARRELEGELRKQQDEAARLLEQARVLADANRELTDANQQLTTTNAELRSGNEELLVANEEVQAATEEVETLNEELQATNEELETLNEELQATVEELNTTNDDLQARSLELKDAAQELTVQRRTAELEQARRQAVLDALPQAMLAVDARGRPLFTNRAFRALLPGGPDELRDAEGRPPQNVARLLARAAKGGPGARWLQTPDGHRLELEAHPVKSDEVAAVVVFRPWERSPLARPRPRAGAGVR
jgi:two-component system CheB/CheR fusion protein